MLQMNDENGGWRGKDNSRALTLVRRVKKVIVNSMQLNIIFLVHAIEKSR